MSLRSTVTIVLSLTALTGCIPSATTTTGDTEIANATPIVIDGERHSLSTTLISLGALDADRVLRIEVDGDNVDSVLILLRDAQGDTATIAGGGPPRMPFQYRVQSAGEYLLYALPRSASSTSALAGRTIFTVGPGDPIYAPPRQQAVRIVFEAGVLTDPGLTDPTSFTPDQVQLIAGLEPLVREGVLDEVRRIFAGTPIEIYDDSQPAPPQPFSILTFTPRRMNADPGMSFDTALPDVDPTSSCASDPLIFGELLPHGIEVDPGNQNLSDAAVVYVGSFQGRGQDCQTAVLGSIDNMILALAHTAAHEIGHLVGLYHLALVDVMDRRPTVAFQRDLGLARGQILIDISNPLQGGGTQVDTRVLTSFYQDPVVYFQTAFAAK